MTSNELVSALGRARWRKSSHSNSQGACVELAPLPGGIAVRDSQDPTGPVLLFAPGPWMRFVLWAKEI